MTLLGKLLLKTFEIGTQKVCVQYQYKINVTNLINYFLVLFF